MIEIGSALCAIMRCHSRAVMPISTRMSGIGSKAALGALLIREVFLQLSLLFSRSPLAGFTSNAKIVSIFHLVDFEHAILHKFHAYSTRVSKAVNPYSFPYPCLV